MNTIQILEQNFFNHIKKQFQLESLHPGISLTLKTDNDTAQGELASNAALILAKLLKKSPRDIAQQITESFSHPALETISIAGPGFINLTLTAQSYKTLLTELMVQKADFFVPETLNKKRFNVEFVSGIPTGPLHIGHGRNGIIGDTLSKILRFIGHDVTKEYYVNDAGNQIAKLGRSFKIRCQQALGMDVGFPEDGYHGQYLIDLAQTYTQEHGKKILDLPDTAFTDYAKNYMLSHIKETLIDYGIEFDVWFSEKSLHTNGSIERALKILADKDLTYTKDNALWFKSTEFGDDKDRVLKKADGVLTYAAADVAYMENKIERKFNEQVMILGQDHHSYKKRLEGIMEALGHNPDQLHVILYQLVTLKDKGELIRMSKRAGTMISLRDVIKAVGKDVARFFFLNKKADAHLDFDVKLAQEHSEKNPVFYIQYAYVRTISILNKAKQAGLIDHTIQEQYLGPDERTVIRKILSLSTLLMQISNNYHTHALSYFTIELAQTFHSYYGKNRIVDTDKPEQSGTRLALVHALNITLATCLELLGISRPEKM